MSGRGNGRGSGRGTNRRLAGLRFAVPLAGAHVRRVFDERCPGR
ncbi:hypothetical protein ACFQS1_24985 [Paractinoplanes rhizophilus]|uniref:Uncharacterized protein n=1 Tax=Paractinoplanes rhizophilus TaxID=1416877 RepID=A0ABW2HXK8_9ACTN